MGHSWGDAYLLLFSLPPTHTSTGLGRKRSRLHIFPFSSTQRPFSSFTSVLLAECEGADWTLLLISAVQRPWGSPPWTLFKPLIAKRDPPPEWPHFWFPELSGCNKLTAVPPPWHLVCRVLQPVVVQELKYPLVTVHPQYLSLKVEASEWPAVLSPSGWVPELSVFVFSASLVPIPRVQVSKSTFRIFLVH